MQKLVFIFSILLVLSACTNASKKQDKILFITSNQHTYGDTDINAANHFAEIVLAYDVFIKAAYQVDFVSPEGGAIPIGYISTSDATQKKYLYDSEFMNLLKHTFQPKDINALDYKAVYYSGGGAAMFGVAENKEIQDIATKIYSQNGVVSSVCHGTAGIVNLKTADGKSLYEGKKVSGFPDAFENTTAEYYLAFPFSIEETIRKNGGVFDYSKEGWDNFSIAAERLITGQDPSATIAVAKKVIETINKQNN